MMTMLNPLKIHLLGSYMSGKSTLAGKLQENLRITNIVKVQRTKVVWDVEQRQNLTNITCLVRNANNAAMAEAVENWKKFEQEDAFFDGGFESIGYLHHLDKEAYEAAAVSPQFAEVVERLRDGLVFLLFPHEEFFHAQLPIVDPSMGFKMHFEVSQFIRDILNERNITYLVIDEYDLQQRAQKVINKIAFCRRDLIIDNH